MNYLLLREHRFLGRHPINMLYFAQVKSIDDVSKNKGIWHIRHKQNKLVAIYFVTYK